MSMDISIWDEHAARIFREKFQRQNLMRPLDLRTLSQQGIRNIPIQGTILGDIFVTTDQYKG